MSSAINTDASQKDNHEPTENHRICFIVHMYSWYICFSIYIKFKTGTPLCNTLFTKMHTYMAEV